MLSAGAARPTTRPHPIHLLACLLRSLLPPPSAAELTSHAGFIAATVNAALQPWVGPGVSESQMSARLNEVIAGGVEMQVLSVAAAAKPAAAVRPMLRP